MAERFITNGSACRAKLEATEKSQLLIMTEHFLVKWITKRLKDNVSVDGPQIREQAKIYCDALCRKNSIVNPKSFSALRV